MLKELKIADIQVGPRHRKDRGDLAALAGSIRQGTNTPTATSRPTEVVLLRMAT